MAFFENFFTKKNGKKSEDQDLPLKDAIPNYASRVQTQVANLNLALDTFNTLKNTSLDVILSKSLNVLRSALVEYARMLEQVLIVKKVVSLDSGPRKRSLTDIVALATDKLKFYGGSKALESSRFLSQIQNEYLSNVDDRVVIKHLRVVRTEFETLALFIAKN